MNTLSSANVTDVNLVLKERTHMRLCINMLIFTHNLGKWLIRNKPLLGQYYTHHITQYASVGVCTGCGGNSSSSSRQRGGRLGVPSGRRLDRLLGAALHVRKWNDAGRRAARRRRRRRRRAASATTTAQSSSDRNHPERSPRLSQREEVTVVCVTFETRMRPRRLNSK